MNYNDVNYPEGFEEAIERDARAAFNLLADMAERDPNVDIEAAIRALPVTQQASLSSMLIAILSELLANMRASDGENAAELYGEVKAAVLLLASVFKVGAENRGRDLPLDDVPPWARDVVRQIKTGR